MAPSKFSFDIVLTQTDRFLLTMGGGPVLYLWSSVRVHLQNTLNNMLIPSLFFFNKIKACVSQPSSNQCSQENHCFNGGTCTELCAQANRKFNCTCAIGYFGKFCEKKSPTSCKQLQLAAKKPRQSAVYAIYDPTSKSFYQTFCDFTSENGFVWTLLESFRLFNKNEFQNKTFYQDHRVNQKSFTWNKFRLPLVIMNSTLSHSTHFRATCNFNTDGLSERQDDWSQYSAAKHRTKRKNGIYQYQRLWLLWLHG